MCARLLTLVGLVGLTGLPGCAAASLHAPVTAFVFTPAMLEGTVPALMGCSVSKLSEAWTAAWLAVPEVSAHDTAVVASVVRVHNVSQAQVIVIPGYLANMGSWPLYPAPGMSVDDNYARTALQCRREIFLVIDALNDKLGVDWSRQRLAVLETHDVPLPQLQGKDLLPAAAYECPFCSFFRLAPNRETFRTEMDVSILPPTSTVALLLAESLDQRRSDSPRPLLASFKGTLNATANHVQRRQRLRDAVERISGDVHILSTEDELTLPGMSAPATYDTLMAHSDFALVLGGDEPWSFRLNEAVCSGAVPVYISNSVAPLETVQPFSSYGIVLSPPSNEADMPSFAQQLVSRLKQMPRAERSALRARAAWSCKKMYSSTAAGFAGALLAFSALPIATTPVGSATANDFLRSALMNDLRHVAAEQERAFLGRTIPRLIQNSAWEDFAAFSLTL